jgi:hypothetical protein
MLNVRVVFIRMRVSLAVSKQYFSVEGASGVCVGLHASLCCLPFRIDLILYFQVCATLCYFSNIGF